MTKLHAYEIEQSGNSLTRQKQKKMQKTRNTSMSCAGAAGAREDHTRQLPVAGDTNYFSSLF